MTRSIQLPPKSRPGPDGTVPGGWWHDDPTDGRIVCDLCPRECHLKPGDRGFCFVRENRAGAMVLTTYGRSTGFCIDPIEKKPLNHFYPGSSVLSFGTAGCNLGCKFCQNWDISKSKEVARLSELAGPEVIAEAAAKLDCRSVAFTYNDPIIWAEYAIDTARACRERDIRTVAVTAGYITPQARGPFFEHIDAANVDLKAFTEDFYRHVTYSHIQPVLDTLEWLKKETEVWFEITNLVIPRENDSPDEIRAMCGWILEHCGDEVPLHFSAFHPDFRMTDRPATPHETLLRAYEIAKSAGLKYVYTGNVNDQEHQSTYCPHCGQTVIERNWYELGAYRLVDDACSRCGGKVAGRFADRPGDWGRKRQPVDISRFGRPAEPDVVQIARNTESVPMSPSAPSAEKPTAPALTDEQKAAIQRATCRFVAGAVLGKTMSLEDPTLAGSAGLPVSGAYVTLKRQGHLRACTGMLSAALPLSKALRESATHTATQDHRLPPISVTELPYLDVDVNLLFNDREVTATGQDRVSAVEAGRHGLRIRRGGQSGLLLPGVAVENGWDSESFLRHICRKAGLPTTAWQDDDTVLHSFESVEFGGPFDADLIKEITPALQVPRIDRDTFSRIATHARANVVALARGMTPEYYLYGVADGHVAGLIVTLGLRGVPEPVHLAQMSLRPGVPLQATLFRVCEVAAKQIAASGVAPEAVEVGLIIFTDAAMQGTLADPDLRGLETSRRAVMVCEANKTCWLYDPQVDAPGLLEEVKSNVDFIDPERAAIYSLEAVSTSPRLSVRSVAKPQSATGSVRKPAMAGRFYPHDAAELDGVVGDFLAATVRRPEAWPVAMVPHAGLKFSGKVAAAVLNRLEIPDTVIVIGPKHTPNGVDWAVDPHSAWAIPGATISGDPEVANALAAAIPGLQLDASAHASEHAIEVELPFLAKLRPDVKVVGIAIGGGNWELCRKFATGLAGVLKTLPNRPLLLISSDMNHFATISENRLLDEVALEAMEQLDPELLLKTVTEHNISMCGVLPAVIAMETLKQLGGLSEFQRVAYATSAEVSGETSRVVGYAGVLIR